ncbi:unnamed protein product [Heligmosomoides polygyrus]|uniref:HTH_48 domain-containing protein n=1 Tax=Heligmosomoides polygyrus TaxID=6339 RepID=A0A183FZL1_HELPZ|nr:unnamed protein product [Heligmosomoides polygyrus]
MDQGRIRTFVYYEWLLGNDTGTAVANICRACKEDAVSQRTVRRWFNRFESGDTSPEDREHSGRPSTVDDDEVRLCIKEKPEAATRELATTLGYSNSGPLDPHRPRRASVYLLHDNACPHVAKETQQKLATIGWETVAHPPYSTDLVRSDYHLFRPLKHHLAGRKFTNYDNLKSDVADFFESQPRSSGRRASATCPIDGPLLWITVVIVD